MKTSSRTVAEAAAFVRARTELSPQIGIVLGSGLMHLATRLEVKTTLSYAEIPHFPISRVKGHAGALHVGRLGAEPIACLAGRVHGYEGHATERVVFGVRVLAELGCQVVILTNAAGSVRPELRPGSLMLITDHLNLTGNNPLVGWHQCPKFLDMSDAYDCRLRSLAKECATKAAIDLKEGVYAGLAGPSYETPAEIRMLAELGASAVGMSTVCETIALRDVGVRVIGISCITNVGAGIEGSVLDHEHVQENARRVGHRLENLVECLAQRVFHES